MNASLPDPQRSIRRLTPRWLLALLCLCAFLPAVLADQTLVPTGSVWRYLDNGSDQGTGWRAPAFDDSGWAWGPAQLGYGDGDEVTTVSYGANSSAKYITTYFRKSFTVADAAAFTGLNLRVLRDDGVVVYLNGTEIYRNNLPTGTISYTTLAPTAISGTEESTTFLSSSPGTGVLVTGNNVLAVEIHQQSGTSSDISFDLELTGVTPGQPSVTRGPYLQKSTPGSMTFRWRTSAATDSRVRYGTSLANLDQTAASATATTEHSVTLSDLTPNALYYYAVGNAAGDLVNGADYFFYTPPPVGTVQPMRFWVLGDAGTGTSGQLAVRNTFYNFAGTRYTDLILLLGDNAYSNGTDAEYQAKHFNIYQTMLRSTASFSTVGNHDTASLSNPDINTTPYFLMFDHPTAGEGGGVPSGTEKYYSFNYGNIHFVCLDSMTSDRSVNGAMLTWLDQDLAQNTADWLIAFFHHPPYSKGSHNSDTEGQLIDMRANALPILEDYGVDLVLSGHSHSYERSFLLDGHYGLSGTLTVAMKLDAGSGREDGTGAYAKADTGPGAHQGAVYVVPGSAGQISDGTLNHPAMFVSLNQLGSFVLDVNGQRLDAKFITDTGTTNDHFTLVKGPQGNLPPSIGITSPAEGATLLEGSTILITAEALDSDGTVTAVDFYADGNLLGSDTSAPFSFSWAGASLGAHGLAAVATDDDTAQTTSPTVNITVTVPPTPPAAPTALAASAASGSQIDLSWADNSGNEDGFQIERSDDGVNFSSIATPPANTTTYADTGLTPNTTHHYRVRAYNSAGVSADSNIASAATPDVPPAAPTGLAATAPSSTQVNLSWTDNADNETGFKVERSTDNVNFSQIATTSPNVTTFSDTTVTAGTTYYYRVRGSNGIGDSGYSNTASVATPASSPAAPSNLAASSPTKKKIQITWTDNANNESGFRIERSTNGTTWTQIATTGANVTAYTNTGLTSGTTYYYRVRAYNASGSSTYSNTASARAK
jgi:hypothetical protein